MIIPFYILRRFLKTFMIVTFFLMILVFLVDLVEQIARYSGEGARIGRLFNYSLLRLTDNFLQFSPLIVLLSSLLCFVGLSRTSEIVIMRAAGLPATRFVFIPVLAVGIISLLMITFINPFYVSARKLAQSYENQFIGKAEGDLGVSGKNGMWLRSRNGDNIRIFRLQNVQWQHQVLKGVTIYNYKLDGGIESEMTANDARIQDGKWLLRNVNIVEYGEEIKTTSEKRLEIPANEGFENFFNEFYSPRNVTNFALPKYIEELESDNYDAKEARSYFYSELAQPILLMSLCLIGAIFALAPERMGGTIQRMLLSISVGFVVFIVNRLATSMGVAGTLPIEFSVLIIPVVSIFFATAILLRQEDG